MKKMFVRRRGGSQDAGQLPIPSPPTVVSRGGGGGGTTREGGANNARLGRHGSGGRAGGGALKRFASHIKGAQAAPAPAPAPAPAAHSRSSLGPFEALDHTDLAVLLAESGRMVTVKEADSIRTRVVTAISAEHSPAVLSGVFAEYVPYALTFFDLENDMLATGRQVLGSVNWPSALSAGNDTPPSVEGGLAVEAAMAVMYYGICLMREVFEIPAALCPNDEIVLNERAKKLQIAAGVFRYAQNSVLPRAISTVAQVPAPELYVETAAVLVDICLAAAQFVAVRRATERGAMPAAMMAKLAAAGYEFARDAREAIAQFAERGVELVADLSVFANDLALINGAWAHLYAAKEADENSRHGEKIAFAQAAVEDLVEAKTSRLVGEVAGAQLEKAKELQDQYTFENSRLHLAEVPPRSMIALPVGRPLAKPTAFEGARVAFHKKKGAEGHQ